MSKKPNTTLSPSYALGTNGQRSSSAITAPVISEFATIANLEEIASDAALPKSVKWKPEDTAKISATYTLAIEAVRIVQGAANAGNVQCKEGLKKLLPIINTIIK